MRIGNTAAAVLLVASLHAQPALIDRAKMALDRGHPEAAVPMLQSQVAQSPSDSNAHYLLGVAYGKLAEKANFFRQPSLARHARDEFERAVQFDPNNLDARFALVQYYTLAPSMLGGSKRKAMDEAQAIRSRNAAMGDRAMSFISSR